MNHSSILPFLCALLPLLGVQSGCSSQPSGGVEGQFPQATPANVQPGGGAGNGPSCTAQRNTAVSGSLLDASGGLVKPESVMVRVDGGSPTACDAFGYGSYSCFEQGGGMYEVTVVSGGKATSQSAFVPADACHTTERKTLDFIVQPPPLGQCTDVRIPIADVDTSAVQALMSVQSDLFYAPPSADTYHRLSVYAAPGLPAGVEQSIHIVLGGSSEQCPDMQRHADIAFVPKPNGCSYDVVSLQLLPQALTCEPWPPKD